MNPETEEDLADRLEAYNRAYRQGVPAVGDAEYDELVERLRAMNPDHPFLQAVEPEAFPGRRQVRHPVPMLSIEKAYSPEQLGRFVARVQKEAQGLGMKPVAFRLTPKLDGLAGRDDGRVFVTRGNGETGYEISSAFAKGVIPVGGRGGGVGEIVVVQSYFDQRMTEFFEHPRNMVVGIVSSETLNANAQQALRDGMVHFVPYSRVASIEVDGPRLEQDTGRLIEELLARVDYPTDGVVAEAVDDRLKERMGATAHHYRWQIAIKTKGQTAQTTVSGIQWQVGRTGNVTPVMEVDPVSLSGATIRRVTAHHAGNIRNAGIGVGSRIEVIRSGEVIPKLEAVVSARGAVDLPRVCPSCSGPLVWQNDFLRCPNTTDCRAQIEQRISHWFRTLGNADWFGIKTIRRIVDSGHASIEAVYRLSENAFVQMGFGPVQSRNLADAIALSRTKPVEDWRFLAAFGIADLGTGDSRKLTIHFPIQAILSLTQEQIAEVKGFGEITSRRIADDLERLRPLMVHMLDLGFNLQRTPPPAQTAVDSPIAGKAVVFTGKMARGSREEMQAEARALGARVQTAVSGSTDYLVCGENVGASKLEKARKLAVTILSQDQYLELVANGRG